MTSWPKSSMVRRKGGAVALLGLLAAASLLLSLSLGSQPVPLSQVAAALGGRADTVPQKIVLLVRLPRTLGCALAGAALGVAGCLIQGVLQNPMASPGVIGVNAGAGVGVAFCCALFPSRAGLVPLAAFLGAVAACGLILALSQGLGASRMTVVLAGIAISGIFSAVIDLILTLTPDALAGYNDFRIGGFSGLTLARVTAAGWVILPALGAALALAGTLDLLLLGRETAQSLGLNAGRARVLLLCTAAALAGGAVSLSGLVGFVGLMVPHALRRLVGQESLPLLAGSAFGGAALVTLCDLAARTAFAPYEIPVGIPLSLLGGPFFLMLLLGQRRGRSHG